ncbi:MAG: response regulator [Lachnospiraceae bacterium]|nr:response regulator [Lachnospiraceae bacterium]
MLQRSYVFYSKEEAALAATGMKEIWDGGKYGDAVAHIYSCGIETEDVAATAELIKKAVPGIKTVGISLFRGSVLEDDDYIRCSVLFLESARAEVLNLCENETGIDCAVKKLHSYLDKTENVRGVELYPSGAHMNMSAFMDAVTKGYEDIPFFGAAANFLMFETKNPIIYTMGEEIGEYGINAVVYSGESLHIHSDYVLGWKPIGKEMDVTETPIPERGDCGLKTIDGMPAVKIYEKYLGVSSSENLTWNTCEFPLYVERNGCPMARVPAGFNDRGELFLLGDIREGEKLRFSYAKKKEVLSAAREGCNRVARFEPEAIELFVCGNRTLFLKEDASTELDYFAGINPNRSFVHGMCEIYRHHGRGGILNSALVIIGMREGEPSGRCSECEVEEIKHPDNEIIPLEERIAVFLGAMTEELRDAVKSANAANEAKSSFLSNMSHEIRTPINAVLGMDEMILRETKEDNTYGYAENIRTAGNTLLGLVNDILDFSKIEAGKMDIIPVDYDFASVLNDLVNMVRQRAENKGLSVEVNVNPEMPNLLHGDEIRIKQIATNILTNAVKYTEKGGITIDVDFDRHEPFYITLKMSISDTGIGIKPEAMEHLFNAFERIEEERNRNIEGTGLGMNITQRLLKLMGSKLNVESEYGKGSTFSFEVAQNVVKWDEIGDYEAALKNSLAKRRIYKEKFIAPNARILVVDDTPMNLTVFEALLKKTRILIDKAESGAEAIALTRKGKYDIIFLDHRMPEKDGIETLKEIREEETNPNKDTVSISLTANAVSGAREQYIEAGFEDYLTKPIDSEKLEEMLIEYLPGEKVMEASEDEDTIEDEAAGIEDVPEWLKAVREIDVREGLKNNGHNLADYLSTVEIFKDYIGENARVIERLLNEKDWKNYTTKVHALKSSARIIGAMALSEFAAKLEKAGNEEDTESIERDTPALLEEYRSFIESLRDNKEEEKLPLISAVKLMEAYRALREFAASLDFDNAEFIINEVDKYRLPKAEEKRYAGIKEALMNLDWDRIKALIG